MQRREQMVGDAVSLADDALHRNRIHPNDEEIPAGLPGDPRNFRALLIGGEFGRTARSTVHAAPMFGNRVGVGAGLGASPVALCTTSRAI